MIPFQPKQCSECGCALNVHQAVRGTTCTAQRCIDSAMRRTVAALEADRLAALQLVATQWLNDLSQHAQLGKIALIALPGYESSLQSVPAAQVKALREHIQQMVSEATAIHVEHSNLDSHTHDQEQSAPPDKTSTTACATCRGHCCRSGGSRAYIDARTICRVRSLLPSLSDDEIVSLYVNAVPDLHLADSCVFHGNDGCSLPRTVRSEICNTYYCRPMINWSSTRQPGTLAVAVVQDSRVIRSAIANVEPMPTDTGAER